ncbi:MAG TPA: PadR family transcriptional regulator [Mycobacterium sp.]|nr:PadR family transcriptional regulator [Mycobacterium sp.]
MQLTNASYVMLGMLSVGSKSGYEIRRSAELSLRYFWTVSPTQIYTELARLEEAKLVRGVDGTRGKRPRRTFKLTAAGRKALRSWLLDDDLDRLEIRDQFLLKLFFADALNPAEVTHIVQLAQARSRRAMRTIERVASPAAQKTLDRHGATYPSRVATFYAELHQFLLDWCDRLADELAAPPATGSRRERPAAR